MNFLVFSAFVCISKERLRDQFGPITLFPLADCWVFEFPLVEDWSFWVMDSCLSQFHCVWL